MWPKAADPNGEPRAATRRLDRHLNRLLDLAIERAGLRRIRFHDLRHTCASLLLAQGVSPRVVMELLGHTQLSMTTDLYGHVMPSSLRAAADALDGVFGQ